MKTILVWDLPLRFFHWILVILVGISFYTGLTGGFSIMDYHMLSGYSILTLVIFRIGWGFLGSRHARFSSFVRGPNALIQSARQLLQRSTPSSPGHNPLGGLSILAMLIALLVQAGTGLFANDDIFVEGPLMHLVSDDTSDWLTEIHEANAWIVCGLVILHIGAVIFYEVYKHQRLVIPMFIGRKKVDDDVPPAHHRIFLAVVLFALSASIVYLLVNQV